MSGTITHIFVCASAGEPMKPLREANALVSRGLEGDRYASGEGSWNKGKVGNRQVTLIGAHAVAWSGFAEHETRRNIVVEGAEIMPLIGRKFRIGGALFRGVKYCEPCPRPGTLVRKEKSFREVFFDRGGVIAEVLESGTLAVGDELIVLPKDDPPTT